MKTIGATFASELEMAGLLGLPFAWDETGRIAGLENLTPAQRAALQGVLDAHDPVAPMPATDPVDVELASNAALRRLVAVLARRLPGIADVSAFIDEIKAEP